MIERLVNYLPFFLRRHVAQRTTLLSATENTGWIVANNILRLLVGMVVSVWVARYLGPTQFGLFSYATSFNAFLTSIIPLGLTQLAIRDLARSREERNTILGSAFYVQVLVSIVMLLVAVGVAFFFQQDDPVTQKLTLILSVTLLLAPFDTVGFWFQSQLQSLKMLIANTTSLIFMASARIWLMQVDASLEAFVYLIIAERVINLLTLFYLYQKSGESIRRWNFDGQRAKHSFWEGLPLFWTVIARSVYARGTEIMLKSLASPSAVGYYASAYKIANLYALVPTAIVTSAMPIIAKSKTQNRTLYLNQLTSLLRVTGGIGLGVTVIISILAPWLMPLIYGPQFAAASASLAVNIWSAVPASLNLITGIWVINEGLAPVQLQKIVVMAGLVVLFNWLLIPRYEAPGAAMSTLIASLIVNIVWDFIDPRMRNFAMLKMHAVLPWWFGLKNI